LLINVSASGSRGNRIRFGIDPAKTESAVHGGGEVCTPTLVRPEVARAKRGNSAAADAVAICEAVSGPNIPFVPDMVFTAALGITFPRSRS
jgi:hypothetical protein